MFYSLFQNVKYDNKQARAVFDLSFQMVKNGSQNYQVEVNFCSIYEAGCPFAFKVGHGGVLLYGAITHRTAVVYHMDLLGPKLVAHQCDVLS